RFRPVDSQEAQDAQGGTAGSRSLEQGPGRALACPLPDTCLQIQRLGAALLDAGTICGAEPQVVSSLKRCRASGGVAEQPLRLPLAAPVRLSRRRALRSR